MAQASVTKRIRLTERVVKKASGTKRNRYEQKLAYLKSLSNSARFSKGPKTLGEGGYR
jgi:hypothetical protein